MKARVFYASANHPKFVNVLEGFAEGVRLVGDEAKVVHDFPFDDDWKPLEKDEVSVIWGSWKYRDAPHHNAKRYIISNSKNFIVLETPILGRGPQKDVMDDTWYRVGLNGFLANDAVYADSQGSDDRWKKIQKKLGVRLEPWKDNPGGYVVVALQLPGDASIKGVNIAKWAADACEDIRSVTDRPIVVRTPQIPREYDPEHVDRITKIENLVVQAGTRANMKETLDKAWCVVTCTSGFGVDALLAGVPVIATDPRSFVRGMGPIDPKDVEKVVRPDREPWVKRLSYYQWSDEEVREGLPWKYLKVMVNED